ncbi:MAG TPA: alkaline phosphatase family protein [Nitrospiraceae bacterium]|nr:alkaline phosphatase family protein [Nitrospiraceae bacterium]
MRLYGNYRRLYAILVLFTALLVEVPAYAGQDLPRPDHIVIVIEENHSFKQIIGSPAAPYLNQLAAQGALLTNYYGVTHPSQPNYLALFAGLMDTGIENKCPLTINIPNMRSALAQVGRTFTGYAEDLPAVGATDCILVAYARKHVPWVNWQESQINQVPPAENRPMTDFPSDFDRLPTVSIVVPNQRNDMHDGSDPQRIKDGDAWLQAHLEPYVQWAFSHNSLLIVTWDEDDGDHRSPNQIPTILVGPMVQPGRYEEKANHYSLLRTILDMYGAQPIGLSRQASPIRSPWKPVSP